MKQRRVKIPTSVLERAKAAVEQTPARKPAPPAQPRASTKHPLAREKVIAALKKLHPMD
jgi:hypothetical protein